MLKVTIVDDYKNILKECFESDDDLVNKWHIESGKGLDVCVNRTYSDMKNLNVKFYGLYDSSNLFGYFAKENVDSVLFLTGFFIKPEYRNEKYIKTFWDMIHKEFEHKVFFVGIYNKNTPAKNFLLRNGFEKLIDIDKYSSVVFRFKGV